MEEFEELILFALVVENNYIIFENIKFRYKQIIENWWINLKPTDSSTTLRLQLSFWVHFKPMSGRDYITVINERRLKTVKSFFLWSTFHSTCENPICPWFEFSDVEPSPVMSVMKSVRVASLCAPYT